MNALPVVRDYLVRKCRWQEFALPEENFPEEINNKAKRRPELERLAKPMQDDGPSGPASPPAGASAASVSEEPQEEFNPTHRQANKFSKVEEYKKQLDCFCPDFKKARLQMLEEPEEGQAPQRAAKPELNFRSSFASGGVVVQASKVGPDTFDD